MHKKYSADFHKIRWKGGRWATEESVRFCWYPDHVTLGFRLGLGLRLGGEEEDDEDFV